MARQEMLMARCDRKECHTVVEIERTTEAPEGWLEIRVEVEGKFDTRAKLEFCSEKCVAIWARDRGKVKNGREITAPRVSNANLRDEVTAAIGILGENGQAEFTANDVASVTEIHVTSVRKHLYEMLDEERLQVIGGDGKKGSPIIYAIR